jgi:hypothetical protein
MNDGKIRDSPEFQEVWRIDYPVENIPARRKGAKWEFLNKEFFEGKYCGVLDWTSPGK